MQLGIKDESASQPNIKTNKNLEWCFKPIIYLLNLVTGIQLNRSEKPEKKSQNGFFTVYSTCFIAFKFYHAIYYSMELYAGMTGNHVFESKHNNNTSKNHITLTSKMIQIIDHLTYIFGIDLIFYVISLSKLRFLWNTLHKIEQHMLLTSFTYQEIRKTVLVGLVILFLVK